MLNTCDWCVLTVRLRLRALDGWWPMCRDHGAVSFSTQGERNKEEGRAASKLRDMWRSGERRLWGVNAS